MTDVFSPAQRSYVMSRVKNKNTSPELKVRSLLHRLGYRFRLHRKDLPGKPDIVLPRFKKVIFVHGCFWHGHSCKKGQHLPQTRADYWQKKIAGNVTRDKEELQRLKDMGWTPLVIWECEMKVTGELDNIIKSFLA